MICAVVFGGALFVSSGSSASAASPCTVSNTHATWGALKAAFAVGGTVCVGANITQNSDHLSAPIAGSVTLDLNGYNLSITADKTDVAAYAAIQTTGSNVTIQDSNPGSNSLTAIGATISVADYFGGAGIGGSSGETQGTLSILSGTINASADAGAGIGGGYRGDGGTINILGGTVNAVSVSGAGIGGGAAKSGGVIVISGGDVTAQSVMGAGIGGGDARNGGTIEISGGIVSASATSPGGGAGIGGGRDGEGGAVTLSGGRITATGASASGGTGGGAAGIGGGSGSSSPGSLTVGSDDYDLSGNFNSGGAGASGGGFAGGAAPPIVYEWTDGLLPVIIGADGASPGQGGTVTVTFSYAVRFNTAGGSQLPTQFVEYGDTASKPVAPTKSEATFAGWVIGSPSGSAYDFATQVTAPLTLVALWSSTLADTGVVENAKVVFITVMGSLFAAGGITVGVARIARQRRR